MKINWKTSFSLAIQNIWTLSLTVCFPFIILIILFQACQIEFFWGSYNNPHSLCLRRSDSWFRCSWALLYLHALTRLRKLTEAELTVRVFFLFTLQATWEVRIMRLQIHLAQHSLWLASYMPSGSSQVGCDGGRCAQLLVIGGILPLTSLPKFL